MNIPASLIACALATVHLALGSAAVANSPRAQAQRWAEGVHAAAGVSGGFVVHIGNIGERTAALRTCDRYYVQGLSPREENVRAARDAIQSLGCYGPVTVAHCDGQRLPHITELVNLVVVDGTDPVPDEAEIQRVLAPHGVALIRSGDGWKRIVKPWPKAIDEWTHYLYDPSNNAVAKDERIAPPRRVRWTAGPLWTRHHDRMASISSVVSAGGRLFYIMDEGPHHSPLLPSQWRVVARDAFNGSLLWKRDIPDWAHRIYPFKSGPARVPRRLVAVGDRLYTTLGITAPVSEIDAATGDVLRGFPDTVGTEEILVGHGCLITVAGGPPPKPYSPVRTSDGETVAQNLGVERDRAILEGQWTESEQVIVAVNLDDGSQRWQHKTKVTPLSVAATASNVVYHDGDAIVSLDLATGKLRWTSAPVARRRAILQSTGVTLVLYDDLVLFTGDDGKITVLSVEDGKQVWAGDHPTSGHYCPQDLLVAGGLVWGGPADHNRGPITGKDPRTGIPKVEIPCDQESYWFHQRCYRSRATERYLIRPVTGTEFVDIEQKQWHLHHWFRSVCLFGFTPANGMIYQTPHPCACYIEAKLTGFNALAAGSALEEAPTPAVRLQKGAAYDSPRGAGPSAADWPTYRHDPARSSCTPAKAPTKLTQAWSRKLGGKLSRLTAANGKIYVAAVDRHTVHTIDAATGEPGWSFSAGGRIDSPPTIDGARVYFGSHDGFVYCLREQDGALVWKFLAAPREAVLVADDQPESVWPVHGSVLVRDNTVYAVAGRSMYLDGGVWLVRLDATSGELLGEVVHDHRDPETQKDLISRHGHLTMPVALPDILSCDGESLYMRSQQFGLDGRREKATPQMPEGTRNGTLALGADQAGADRHIFCPSGFLDDTWFHRAYWIYGRHFPGGAGGWPVAGNYTPAGRILACDENRVYGYGRQSSMYQWRTPLAYHLYAAGRDLIKLPPPKKRPAQPKPKRKRATRPRKTHEIDFHWSTDVDVHARALLLAGDTLFVAGPPALADEIRAFENWGRAEADKQLVAQAEAITGKRGARLIAVNKHDGSKLSETELPAPPVFDGMIAARECLYLATIDGRIVCLAGE
ncbi:MAG: PQQ-binding-like beta-propeller repeat protein [Planctomycetes bacterium]|nr:PQQ-binding-like beta-propeller repeat protein [Planctomycetota bacterium]MBL7038607.1 PQQ-binding-like beta-propeller repeat protein [Pirellulaceae bacterium]